MPALTRTTPTPLSGGAWAKSLLMLLIFLAPAPPVSSQPQPARTRDTVIEEIKVYAGRHVKSGSPMQTQLVVDLYRDNTVGLSRNEIAQIYEEHYTQLKAAAEPGPWGEIFPKAGWIAAGLLALLLIFRDVLKEWVSKFFKAVGSRIYGRLSGYRFFYLISLRHYQRSLLKKYAELHIPFRPNRPLLMREVYVPLRVAGSSSDEQIDAYRAVASHKRLMIKGPPGSGKSMLLKHLALSYAEGRLNHLPDQPVPILLELHRLNDSSQPLEQCLADELARNGFPHAESFVRRNLELGVLMLLFDGLDEVNASQRGRAAQQIRDFLDRYRGCRFICTCRTAIYHDEFAGAVAQTLEVVEFKDQQIRRFLRSWEPGMPEGKSIEQLMQTLSDRPRIMALARNPLLLTIIAYLYTDTNFVLPHSRAEFYEKSTDFLLDQWKTERNQFKAREKRLVLQQLALAIQDSAARGGRDRRTMEFKAVLNHVRQVLPDLSLQPDDARPLLDEIVERSGLLLAIDGGARYSFAHLTLQEFFAAGCLRDDATEMIGRFKADRDIWRETIKLWCGLAIDSTHLIEAVHEADPITAFECLADAQKVDQALAAKIVEEFKSHLGTKENETAIVQAFGSVAADSRPRGAAVFEFLEETLDAPDPFRCLAAANALSRTNLPRAAKVLAERGLRRPELRPSLVRMGDLAVPALLSLTRTIQPRLRPTHFYGRENTATAGEGSAALILDGLHAIGTPQAARAMTTLLWDENTELAAAAAWRLAALLSNPDIEESLRDYPLDAERRRLPRLDWVWEPFSEPAHSSLPLIAGRVAHLIDHGMPPDAPLPLTPRLVIPLCATKGEKEFAVSRLWDWETQEEKLKVQRVFESLAMTPIDLDKERALIRKQTLIRAVSDSGILSASHAFSEMPVEYSFSRFKEAVLTATNPPPRWRYLLSCLKPISQYDLLRRLIKGPTPTRADWLNIFTPVKYEFRRGWQFQLVVIFFAVITVVSLIQMAKSYTLVTDWLGGWGFFLLLAAVVGIIFYWVQLRKFRFEDPIPFDHQDIEMALGVISGGLLAPVIILIWQFIEYVRRPQKPTFKDASDRGAALLASLIIVVAGAVLGLPMAAIIFFTSLAIDSPWQYVLLFWAVSVGICAVLWVLGRWRHRAAQNPLSNMLEPVTGSGVGARPKGVLAFLLRLLRG